MKIKKLPPELPVKCENCNEIHPKNFFQLDIDTYSIFLCDMCFLNIGNMIDNYKCHTPEEYETMDQYHFNKRNIKPEDDLNYNENLRFKFSVIDKSIKELKGLCNNLNILNTYSLKKISGYVDVLQSISKLENLTVED